MKKILGIDYGNKRIGIAVGHATMGIVFDRRFVANTNNQQVFDTLEQIIKQDTITDIVVGLPYYPSGEESPQLGITRDFILELKKHTSLPIYELDERVTTKIAKQKLSHYSFHKHRHQDLKDGFSAQILVENFLTSFPKS